MRKEFIAGIYIGWLLGMASALIILAAVITNADYY